MRHDTGFCVHVLASDLAGNLGVDTMEFSEEEQE
jgi:hypothetical protein